MIFAALEKRGGRQRKSGDCEKFNLTSLKIDSFGCKIRFASHYIARVKGVFFFDREWISVAAVLYVQFP